MICFAVVAELADARDSKSRSRKGVWVRPPPTAFIIRLNRVKLIFHAVFCSSLTISNLLFNEEKETFVNYQGFNCRVSHYSFRV